MLKKSVDIWSGIIAGSFLVLSIFARFIKNVKLIEFLNTDGLAIAGCTITLIAVIIPKFDFFKRIINKLVYKMNFIELDYKLDIEFTYDRDELFLLQEVAEYLKLSISEYKRYSNQEMEPLNLGQRQECYTFKPMASNIVLKKYPENILVITFEGVVKSKRFQNNISFILHHLIEDLKNNNFKIKNINLSIFRENTENLVMDKGFFSHIGHYDIHDSNIEIMTDDDTLIKINNHNGISLNTRTKKAFITGIVDLQYILIK